MYNNSVRKDDQIKLIMECRQSGLSDYHWCIQNNIKPGTFYNWISKLRKSGYTFPDSQAKKNASPVVQEVVKLDVLQEPRHEARPMVEQNACVLASSPVPHLAAELVIDGISLRLYNGADEILIQNTLRCIGGMNHAW